MCRFNNTDLSINFMTRLIIYLSIYLFDLNVACAKRLAVRTQTKVLCFDKARWHWPTSVQYDLRPLTRACYLLAGVRLNCSQNLFALALWICYIKKCICLKHLVMWLSWLSCCAPCCPCVDPSGAPQARLWRLQREAPETGWGWRFHD